ncbi:MAG: sterol-binding protein [Actinophytocola sp.]|nr:sterol-binding protein [Actinophytocola sp.]
MLGDADAGVHLSTLSTDSLVRLVSRASKEQLKGLAGDEVLRPFFLDEIFRRMSEQLIPEKVRDISIVVSWRFTNDDVEDGFDRYQMVVEAGEFAAAKDLDRIPDTTVTLSVYDFILMATGNTAFASMFVTGKVKVKGDYSIAALLTTYFDIPKPV